jgi:hypothetical protein
MNKINMILALVLIPLISFIPSKFLLSSLCLCVSVVQSRVPLTPSVPILPPFHSRQAGKPV